MPSSLVGALRPGFGAYTASKTGSRGDDEHTGEGAAVDGDHGQLRRAGADHH